MMMMMMMEMEMMMVMMMMMMMMMMMLLLLLLCSDNLNKYVSSKHAKKNRYQVINKSIVSVTWL